MIRDQEAVRCLFIPSDLGEVLLPGAAVAEIVRTAPLAPAGPGMPPWLIGMLEWRGQRVPVARFSEVGARTGPRHHIAVCFMPSADRRLPFAGIEFVGLPQLEQVSAKTLEPDDGQRDLSPPFAVVPFKHDGKAAWILDLEAFEHALLG